MGIRYAKDAKKSLGTDKRTSSVSASEWVIMSPNFRQNEIFGTIKQIIMRSPGT
jgi:hypothetical protein